MILVAHNHRGLLAVRRRVLQRTAGGHAAVALAAAGLAVAGRAAVGRAVAGWAAAGCAAAGWVLVDAYVNFA